MSRQGFWDKFLLIKVGMIQLMCFGFEERVLPMTYKQQVLCDVYNAV
jgi:hypothetical protein